MIKTPNHNYCGVSLAVIQCEKCKNLTSVQYANREHSKGPIGARCSCSAILWTSGIENPILKALRNISNINQGDYHKEREKIFKAFLKSLPNCPNCNKSEYEEIITNDISKVKCGYCNNGILSNMIILNDLNPPINVYWFDSQA